MYIFFSQGMAASLRILCLLSAAPYSAAMVAFFKVNCPRYISEITKFSGICEFNLNR